MAKASKTNKVDRWYPDKSQFPDVRQYEAIRQLTDMIYAAQDEVASVKSEQGGMTKRLDSHHMRITKTEQAGGPSTTKITGLFVKGTPPSNGDTIRFNTATGQFEFGS